MKEPRWVVVIQQNQHELYELLRRSFKENAPLEAIVERRKTDRPRAADHPGTPLRGEVRRQRQAIGWLYERGISPAHQTSGSAATLTFAKSQLPDEPRHVATNVCPTCGAGIEFEVPRFPKPPARLETEVIHERRSASREEHYLEVHAFATSGRRLLGQRVRGRRVW
jgi:hypothetical protein